MQLLMLLLPLLGCQLCIVKPLLQVLQLLCMLHVGTAVGNA